MQLQTMITGLLLAASIGGATQLELRDEGGPTPVCMYLTSDYNWGGEGQNLCVTGGSCMTRIGMFLPQNVSSAGPDDGTMCILYDGEDCTGAASAPIVHPGYKDLRNPLVNFDKRTQSFRCWKLCGYLPDLSSSASAKPTSTQSSEAPPAVSTTVTALTKRANAPQPNPSATISGTVTAMPTADTAQLTTLTDTNTNYYQMPRAASCAPNDSACVSSADVACLEVVATTTAYPGSCPAGIQVNPLSADSPEPARRARLARTPRRELEDQYEKHFRNAN